jgi:PAS domain S-box-containing protein
MQHRDVSGLVQTIGLWARAAGALPPAEERQFRALLEALPVAIYTTDAAGRITFYNQAAVEFSGRRPRLGSDKWCVTWRLYRLDGTPLPHDQCPMAVALREGRAIRGVEAIAERPDGSRVPFMPYPTPLRDAAGNVVGAVNVLIDISNRRQFEETLERRVEERTKALHETVHDLQDSEQRFRLLVEGVTDYAIYMLDPTGIVTNWNTGAERIKGYRADEILGQNFARFYTEEDRRAGRPEEALATAAAEGRFETEAWRVRKTGERFWAGIVLDAIRGTDGQLVGFAKITRDLTERRAIEEQLRQAQKMEAVGQLTGGIAHDFNNLLGAIVPSLEMARLRIEDPVTLRYIDGAARAAERGAKLTHQLLAFSRKQELQMGAVDVNALVQELGEMLPRTLGPTVQLTSGLDSQSPLALTDINQLEAALLNLAINARDAMPTGGTLRITTARAGAGEAQRVGLNPALDYVTIAIADTGSGMTDEVRERAFEPFYTTKGLGKGTGLGLSMVYGFAKQSGGIATIESALGRGSVVRLYLPVAPALPAGDASEEGSLDAGPPSRVLVVDDDDEVRAAAVAMVSHLGHEAVAAASGADALKLLAHDRGFDVMIVDLVMPSMHGTEFATAARALLPQLPVIFMTGYSEVQRIGRAPYDQLLKKPFRRAELAERLRHALGAIAAGDRTPTSASA